MQRKQSRFIKNTLLNIFFSCLMLSVAQAGQPLWTLTIADGSSPIQNVPENGTASVQYVVQNQSSKPKKLIIQSMPGMTQATPCQLRPKGEIGSSCVLRLAINGSTLPIEGIHEGPVLCQVNFYGIPGQCYQPSRANSLNVTRGAPLAAISAYPNSLLFAENSTGEVIISNSASSPVAAYNVAATIPAGSNISVQSTTCGASLAIGASCKLIFSSSTQEGPTIIPITGDNTNTVTSEITVTSQPVISIIGPTQQNRIIDTDGTSMMATPLEIVIENNAASAIAANDINVTDKTNCANVVVDSSNCNSVAPGASCSLSLTSTTPYVPCILTISGSNTANSLTTPLAFFRVGGLVFEENSGSGKVVRADAFNSPWTSTAVFIAGTNLSDGSANTDLIVADASCSNDPANCAAQGCRNYGADWYLPAANELVSASNALCPGGTCNFGGFTTAHCYSSSQPGADSTYGVRFTAGIIDWMGGKSFGRPIRCTRAF